MSCVKWVGYSSQKREKFNVKKKNVYYITVLRIWEMLRKCA